MRKNYILCAIIGLFITNASAQFTKNDVEYWIGNGPDSAVLILDFNESTTNNSLAFGFKFTSSQTITAKAMLDSMVANVANFSTNIGGGFLNDITFGSLVGIGGVDGQYWSTYSGSNFGNLASNTGIGEVLTSNSWFAASYTDYDQVTYEPLQTISSPVAVPNPNEVTFNGNDIEYWIGNGPDSAILILDFNESTTNNSLAFGFRFTASQTISAKAMLDSMVANVANFSTNIGGGFLNDITFGSLSGIGGVNGRYWSTYSGSNFNNLALNTGIGEVLTNNSWFAASYTDYDQVTYEPLQTISNPVAVVNTVGINLLELSNDLKVYVNNSNNLIVSGYEGALSLIDLSGRKIFGANHSENSVIELNTFSSGVYVLNLETSNGIISKKINF